MRRKTLAIFHVLCLWLSAGAAPANVRGRTTMTSGTPATLAGIWGPLWYLKDWAAPRWFYNMGASAWESMP